MAVAGQVEQNRLALAALLAAQRFVDRDLDGVRRFRRGDDALGARELQRRLEGGELRHRDRLDHALVVELAHQRRHPVIAQAAGVQRRRHEAVAERVHLHQRRHADRVAEIVGVFPLGEARARGGLDGDDARLLFLRQLVGRERERQPREVGAAARAADDHVGLVVGLLELLLGLQADDGLVHEHVIEHAAERVLGVVARGGVFHRLADGDAERARRVGILLEDLLARLRVRARARHDLRAPGLHHDPAIGLLLIRDLDHVDLALKPEELTGERQRRAPLARARLRRQSRDFFLLVVVRLRDRGVRLVAAGRAHALVLVVDARRGAERLLESPRAK